MTVYGKLPIYLGQFNFNLEEVMYYLYLPIRMEGFGLRIPDNLLHLASFVKACERWPHRPYRYTYISARKGYATPDNPLNRPGWHCDGFGTDDLNFVWWVGPGTRFAIQEFEGICSDHNRALREFDRQVKAECIVTYPERGGYVIDPSVVHATPVIEPPGCMRQYVKISLSDHRYNLENNSHNYAFEYEWPLHPRELLRNDPHYAGKDYYDRET